MSKATATGQVTVTTDGTTFHTVLQCTLGDLYQTYEGDYSQPTNISPNIEAMSQKPLVVFQAYSAQEGTGTYFNLSSATAKWFVGNIQLTFGSDGVSTNSFGGTTGHFVKATQEGNPALKVVKNIIGVNLGNSFILKCSTTVSVDNTSAELSATIPASITKGTENTKKVSIIATSAKNLFTIVEKGGSCTVEAMVIAGDSVSTKAYTYKWYLQADGGDWTLKKSGSDKQYTVNEAEVNSSALVKLEVYDGSLMYGMDVQSINDVSDPYFLAPNCCKEGTNELRSEVVRRGETDNLVYKPKLYKRGSTTPEEGFKFNMYWYDYAGNKIVGYENMEEISVPAKTISDHNGLCYLLQTTI